MRFRDNSERKPTIPLDNLDVGTLFRFKEENAPGDSHIVHMKVQLPEEAGSDYLYVNLETGEAYWLGHEGEFGVRVVDGMFAEDV